MSKIWPPKIFQPSRKRRFLGIATESELDKLRDLAIHLDEVRFEANQAKRDQIISGMIFK